MRKEITINPHLIEALDFIRNNCLCREKFAWVCECEIVSFCKREKKD